MASKFLKKSLRRPISVVYCFARTADDFADEGNASHSERLHSLDNYRLELKQINLAIHNFNSRPDQKCTFYYPSKNPLFIALADVIFHFTLPIELFNCLIQAFKQDVTTTRYDNFDEILNYCRLSANPVGRILLYLNNSATTANIHYSDAICTGLQLINFYQDIAQDIDENDRLYLPSDEMQHHKVSVDDIRQHLNNKHTRQLLAQQIQRTKKIYYAGAPLCKTLKGRFAIEIRMIYTSGRLILDKLAQNTDNIYLRPRLGRQDKLKIVWQSLLSCHYTQST